MAYITVAECRALGISTDITDDAIAAAILVWTAFIDRATRQFFEPKTVTLDIDGNDSDTLFLPVPVISVTNLYINDDMVTAVPTDRYKVYNGRGPIDDDRRNPKLRLIRHPNIFIRPDVFYSGPVFMKGSKNQRIVGSFGFTESDGSTPQLIKRAVAKMVKRSVEMDHEAAQNNGETPSQAAGDVIMEITDGHTVQYGTNKSFGMPAGKMGTAAITNDPEVEKIIEMYRAPLAIAVPGSMSWFMG